MLIIRSLRTANAVFHDSLFRLSAVLLAWCLVTYVLLPVSPPGPGSDESWRVFLTWAFEHGKQFGTDVIFTYGPWGFLFEPRGTEGIYPWQVLGRFVLAIAASAGIALLGVSWIRSVTQRWIWAATIIILAEPLMIVPVLLFLCTMPSGIDSRWKKPVLFLMAFAAGLAACTKFTCFLLVAALIPVMVLRRCFAVAVSISVSFLLFWLVAGQAVSNLPAFVRQSMEISTGYASAMVLGRPWVELPLALLVCVPPLLQLTRQIIPPVNLEHVACLCWLAVYEFLIFRHGLIRVGSGHLYMAFLSVGIPIAVLLAFLPGNISRVGASCWKVAYGLLLCVAMVVTVASARGAIKQRLSFFMESFRLYPVYARDLSSLRVQERVVSADVGGSVDVFPSELSYAIQKHLPLRNRPVIQAYSAYTRGLCEKNAAFLEGHGAPQTIYFHSAPIDDRYPTMEDSLAWRSLLTHYVPSSVADNYLVLKHRERPAGYELRPILDRGISTDEIIEIPRVPGGLIWAELQVQRTLTGQLLNLLYRNEKMVLRVETTRRTQDFTLVDETAATGFLLSPYVSNKASMLDLFQDESRRFSAESVRRIVVIRSELAALGFSRNVNIKLYSLMINAPAQDVPGGLIEDLSRTVRAERPVGSVAFSPALALMGGAVRLVVGSPSSGWIAREGGKSLRVRYGVEGSALACSGDVSFRILVGGGARNERQILWESTRKAEAGKDWSAEVTVKLPEASGQQRLYFETDSTERSCGAEGSYWADLRMEPFQGR